jgi:flagellar protein FliO/FliZ
MQVAMKDAYGRVAAASTVAVLIWPAWAFAESGKVGAAMEPYLRMIWGLLVVLGLILLLYGLLKKKFSLLAHSPQQQIRIVEIKPLMGKKALCLVEVRGQEFLLGLSGDRIDHIASLAKKSGPTFAETLRKSGDATLP